MQFFSKLIKENLVLALAIVVTLLVYLPFLSFSHISWDDPEMVFKNKAVKDFNFTLLFSGHYVGNYIPVTMLFHAIAWLFFEDNDWGHHLINILFHLVNGLMVYKVGKRLFTNQTIVNFGAIIFLLHPLQIESVGWISELKTGVSAFFFLYALLFYLDFKAVGRKDKYLKCMVFFLLACLAKPSAVAFPLCVVTIDFFKSRKDFISLIYNKIPFFIVAIIFGIINLKTQAADQFINHAHEFPIYQRIGFAGFALLKYSALFILPIEQSVIYSYPLANALVFAIGYLAWVGIIGLVMINWNKNVSTVFTLAFVLSNLILVLQFIPFGEALCADRYMYLAIIGFAWLAGIFISKLKFSPNYIIGVIILFLGMASFNRGKVWTSALSLYEDIIKKYPQQFVALNSSGVECMFLNQDKKALDYFNKAVAAAPNNYKGYYNRGLLYLKNSNPVQAIKSFDETLKLYNYNKAYVGRASAFYMLRDFPKAIRDAGYVIQNPGSSNTNSESKAHFVLGNCYNDMNQLDKAMQEYNKCIELNNEEADFYFKRAIVFGKNQDFNSSLGDLNVCLQLNSKYYEAYYWRGVAKINLKQNPCEDFRIAAQQNYEQAVSAYNKYCR